MSNLHQEILKQLDNYTEEFQFPMLDNGYVYLADTKMSVYANQKKWAIIIEVLGYNYRAWETDGFEDCLYCFGNFLSCENGLDNSNFLHPISNGISAPLFVEDELDVINQFAIDMKIRENLFPIINDPNIYIKNGISLKTLPSINAFEFLRLEALIHRDLLFATKDELIARLQGDLPLLLQLNEWNHPDIVKDEKPSENETFILIANMIDQSDVSIYHPSKLPNTHWSNWPLGGSL